MSDSGWKTWGRTWSLTTRRMLFLRTDAGYVYTVDHAFCRAMIISVLCHSSTVAGAEVFFEERTRAGVGYLGRFWSMVNRDSWELRAYIRIAFTTFMHIVSRTHCDTLRRNVTIQRSGSYKKNKSLSMVTVTLTERMGQETIPHVKSDFLTDCLTSTFGVNMSLRVTIIDHSWTWQHCPCYA